MRRIYQNAEIIFSWLGPDTKDHQAVAAIDAITKVSDFFCRKLDMLFSDLRSISNIYRELVLENRAHLPLPSECDFSSDTTWNCLIWFYSHQYFTRVRVILG